MHVGTTYVVFTDGAAQHRTAQQLVGAGGATVYALTALTACNAYPAGLVMYMVVGPTWQLIRLAAPKYCWLPVGPWDAMRAPHSTLQSCTAT